MCHPIRHGAYYTRFEDGDKGGAKILRLTRIGAFHLNAPIKSRHLHHDVAENVRGFIAAVGGIGKVSINLAHFQNLDNVFDGLGFLE